ncbi:MAG: hypothetical protein AAGD86_02385, partial [Pseudomonadota bacterium]
MVTEVGGSLDGLIDVNYTMWFSGSSPHYACEVKNAEGAVHDKVAWDSLDIERVQEFGSGKDRRVVYTGTIDVRHSAEIVMVKTEHGLDCLINSPLHHHGDDHDHDHDHD